MKKFSVISKILVVAVISMLLGACTPKNVSYMQDFNEEVVIENAKRRAMRVQPEDKLSIVVHSKNPELAALFNLPIVNNNINTSERASEGVSYYTVSPQGTIDFPVLGTLNINGMTRNEIAAFVKGELIGRNLIKDPTVTVEFLNAGVSLLGEVKTPGRYDMNRDNMTVLEAIALAGDLTIQGQRENVKVIRENSDGKVMVYQLDLTQGSKMMESPAYYLKQNDVIYVEPNDIRKRETTVNGNSALSTGFWISAASLLTSIAVLVTNLVK